MHVITMELYFLKTDYQHDATVPTPPIDMGFCEVVYGHPSNPEGLTVLNRMRQLMVEHISEVGSDRERSEVADFCCRISHFIAAADQVNAWLRDRGAGYTPDGRLQYAFNGFLHLTVARMGLDIADLDRTARTVAFAA